MVKYPRRQAAESSDGDSCDNASLVRNAAAVDHAPDAADAAPEHRESKTFFVLVDLPALNAMLTAVAEEAEHRNVEPPSLLVVPICTPPPDTSSLPASRTARPRSGDNKTAAERVPDGGDQFEPPPCQHHQNEQASSPLRLTTAAAVQAVSVPAPAPAEGGEVPLSTRQKEVLECLIQGYSNKQIARTLGLEEGTVRGHVRTVLHKMGAKNRTQAACYAIEQKYTACFSATPIRTAKADAGGQGRLPFPPAQQE